MGEKDGTRRPPAGSGSADPWDLDDEMMATRQTHGAPAGGGEGSGDPFGEAERTALVPPAGTKTAPRSGPPSRPPTPPSAAATKAPVPAPAASAKPAASRPRPPAPTLSPRRSPDALSAVFASNRGVEPDALSTVLGSPPGADLDALSTVLGGPPRATPPPEADALSTVVGRPEAPRAPRSMRGFEPAPHPSTPRSPAPAANPWEDDEGMRTEVSGRAFDLRAGAAGAIHPSPDTRLPALEEDTDTGTNRIGGLIEEPPEPTTATPPSQLAFAEVAAPPAKRPAGGDHSTAPASQPPPYAPSGPTPPEAPLPDRLMSTVALPPARPDNATRPLAVAPKPTAPAPDLSTRQMPVAPRPGAAPSAWTPPQPAAPVWTPPPPAPAVEAPPQPELPLAPETPVWSPEVAPNPAAWGTQAWEVAGPAKPAAQPGRKKAEPVKITPPQKARSAWHDESIRIPVAMQLRPGLENAPIAPDRFMPWLMEAWRGFVDRPLQMMGAHLLVMVMITLSVGLLIGPMMVGYFVFMERMRDGEEANVFDVFEGFNLLGPSMALGLIVWVQLAVVVGLGYATGLLLGFLPIIGGLLVSLLRLIVGVTLCSIFPLLALAFGLRLHREPKASAPELFSAVRRLIARDPPGMLIFGLSTGLLAAVGSLIMGVGALVTGPLAMWIISTAYDEAFEGTPPEARQDD